MSSQSVWNQRWKKCKEQATSSGESFFNVRNQEGSHFLDSKRKQKSVTSDEFSKRPEDLSYFVFLVNVDPKKVVGDRISQQESISTGSSLKLPLSIYDITMDTVIEDLGKCRTDRIDSTSLNKLVLGSVALSFLQSLRKVLFKKEIEEAGDTETDTGMSAGNPATTPPGSPTGTSTPATTSARNQVMGQPSASPKMARLMGNTSTKVATGY